MFLFKIERSGNIISTCSGGILLLINSILLIKLNPSNNKLMNYIDIITYSLISYVILLFFIILSII